MPYADRGAGALYYETLGDRGLPRVVIARGLARSSRYWLGFAELMAERFHVLAFDNRGIGRSYVPRGPYSTRAMADDVACVMDAAGFEDAHYFGLSLAGMIGQWFGIRHPERVRSLALGCTTAFGRVGVPWGVKLEILRSARLPFDQAQRVTAGLTLSEAFVADRPDVLEKWHQLALEEPPARQGLVGQGCAALFHDARRELGRLQASTLLITGDRDRLIPPRCSYDLLRRIPNVRLRILPGVGHDFATEQPQETAEILGDFFLREEASRGGES